VLCERTVNELFTLNLGREQETEADLTGLQLLQRAKIDPSGMIRFFERLSEKDEGRTEWISSHPMSPARAERLKELVFPTSTGSDTLLVFEWAAV